MPSARIGHIEARSITRCDFMFLCNAPDPSSCITGCPGPWMTLALLEQTVSTSHIHASTSVLLAIAVILNVHRSTKSMRFINASVDTQ